jgi:cobalamin biosynthesis protein CobD/CbiB
VSSSAADFESLLREALRPVEPSADLAARLELTLVSLTEMAQDELDSWELSAMRDPRNWVRPAAAVVIGAGAGSALVILRVRNRHRARKAQAVNLTDLAERTLADIAAEARRILPRRS